jgi:hypothetical protein
LKYSGGISRNITGLPAIHYSEKEEKKHNFSYIDNAEDKTAYFDMGCN